MKIIWFEGPKYSGKSTQSKELTRRLREEGFIVLSTCEPGGTLIGNKIREVLLDKELNGKENMNTMCRRLLNYASHLNLMDQIFKLQGNIQEIGPIDYVIIDRNTYISDMIHADVEFKTDTEKCIYGELVDLIMEYEEKILRSGKKIKEAIIVLCGSDEILEKNAALRENKPTDMFDVKTRDFRIPVNEGYRKLFEGGPLAITDKNTLMACFDIDNQTEEEIANMIYTEIKRGLM